MPDTAITEGFTPDGQVYQIKAQMKGVNGNNVAGRNWNGTKSPSPPHSASSPRGGSGVSWEGDFPRPRGPCATSPPYSPTAGWELFFEMHSRYATRIGELDLCKLVCILITSSQVEKGVVFPPVVIFRVSSSSFLSVSSSLLSAWIAYTALAIAITTIRWQDIWCFTLNTSPAKFSLTDAFGKKQILDLLCRSTQLKRYERPRFPPTPVLWHTSRRLQGRSGWIVSWGTVW